MIFLSCVSSMGLLCIGSAVGDKDVLPKVRRWCFRHKNHTRQATATKPATPPTTAPAIVPPDTEFASGSALGVSLGSEVEDGGVVATDDDADGEDVEDAWTLDKFLSHQIVGYRRNRVVLCCPADINLA
ncbi:hypothetical protein Q7P37_002451 [Cladosporium fusiforme]